MIEVIISNYRDGSIRPEVYFAAFHDKEERYARHLVDENGRTGCGDSIWGHDRKIRGLSGLCALDRIDCPACRQLLGSARFALVPNRHLEAVAS